MSCQASYASECLVSLPNAVFQVALNCFFPCFGVTDKTFLHLVHSIFIPLISLVVGQGKVTVAVSVGFFVFKKSYSVAHFLVHLTQQCSC